jgi:hypothetical protein
VPPEHARKVRKGNVRPRKVGYLLWARMTPAVPTSVPMTPPKMPPETVALYSLLASVDSMHKLMICSLPVLGFLFLCKNLHLAGIIVLLCNRSVGTQDTAK